MNFALQAESQTTVGSISSIPVTGGKEIKNAPEERNNQNSDNSNDSVTRVQRFKEIIDSAQDKYNGVKNKAKEEFESFIKGLSKPEQDFLNTVDVLRGKKLKDIKLENVGLNGFFQFYCKLAKAAMGTKNVVLAIKLLDKGQSLGEDGLDNWGRNVTDLSAAKKAFEDTEKEIRKKDLRFTLLKGVHSVGARQLAQQVGDTKDKLIKALQEKGDLEQSFRQFEQSMRVEKQKMEESLQQERKRMNESVSQQSQTGLRKYFSNYRALVIEGMFKLISDNKDHKKLFELVQKFLDKFLMTLDNDNQAEFIKKYSSDMEKSPADGAQIFCARLNKIVEGFEELTFRASSQKFETGSKGVSQIYKGIGKCFEGNEEHKAYAKQLYDGAKALAQNGAENTTSVNTSILTPSNGFK